VSAVAKIMYKVQQRNLMIFKMHEDEMVGTMSVASLTDAVAVAMEQ
jgi:hypothetical protein